MTPTDPLYAQQWHFSLIGDIERIWDEFDGTGVHIAVYDDGVQYAHPDLAPNYDASMHFTYLGVTYDGNASAADEVHGTSVAGIIAAQNSNGQGGTGVAHGVTITGVDVFDPTFTANLTIEEAMIGWAANFDIMSNSWGWMPGYQNWKSLAASGSQLARYDSWYGDLVRDGRDGLGTIIVQAAGNDTRNAVDAVNVSRYTITVSATDRFGFVEDYSNFGSAILIAGPASAVTTDRLGDAGYNASGTLDGDAFQRDYTSTFNGTSAATPTVSGVVALMLQANAGLGWRDVSNILAMSASLTGSDFGGPGTGFEVGSWTSGATGTWNGGASAYHVSYGYGMVDAFAAVRMAEAWLTMHGSAQTSANEQHVTARNLTDVLILDNATVSSDVTVTQNIEVETIYVTVTINHSYASDMIIRLVAPDGRIFQLFDNEGGSTAFDGGKKWTFAVEGARGYGSAGTWSVEVADEVLGDTGFIGAVQLDFHGRTSTTADIYHFTDDFLTLRAEEAGRATITDTDGGRDWINMSAISGDISVWMAAGKTARVDGVSWFTIGSGRAIENLYAGDGNDLVSGNSAANHIVGARGRDTIRGFDGNDTLDGDQGNDRLQGGLGLDSFVFAAGSGTDTVLDFVNDADTLVFDDALWGGGLAVADVIASFGSQALDGARFTFADGTVVFLQGFFGLVTLQDDITIV